MTDVVILHEASQYETICRRCGKAIVRASLRTGEPVALDSPLVILGSQLDLLDARVLDVIDVEKSPKHDEVCSVLLARREKAGQKRGKK